MKCDRSCRNSRSLDRNEEEEDEDFETLEGEGDCDLETLTRKPFESGIPSTAFISIEES